MPKSLKSGKLVFPDSFPIISTVYKGSFVLRKLRPLGPVVQKPINVNPRLKIDQGVYFSTPKSCSTMIFGKTLHYKKAILKNMNKQKKFSPNCEKHETKVYANPGLS